MNREQLKRFAADIQERLEPMGPLDTRPMFGAIGIRKAGVIFGFVHGDDFFLKGDDDTVAAFAKMGSQPFSYEGPKGTIVSKTTWSVPAEVIEDQDAFVAWAERGYEIARQAKAAKKPRKPRS